MNELGDCFVFTMTDKLNTLSRQHLPKMLNKE